MTWARFNQVLARLGTDKVKPNEYQELFVVVEKMINLMDELDGEDAFGTEGWKHRLGLED